jgi:hypothetical protein
MFVTQELVRNDKDVNEYERLSNITLKYKLKQRNIAYIVVLYSDERLTNFADIKVKEQPFY